MRENFPQNERNSKQRQAREKPNVALSLNIRRFRDNKSLQASVRRSGSYGLAVGKNEKTVLKTGATRTGFEQNTSE
ncbi:hypothetical protein [uncultured Aquitalea sp.]|uniref:hypothetical protein n=1 Tax=uncultured Aquitalea sp. TaxID=540272 RepID=UPI0025E80F45|nr:hypothetical protein [uncultured Aquitalea sp.]